MDQFEREMARASKAGGTMYDFLWDGIDHGGWDQALSVWGIDSEDLDARAIGARVKRAWSKWEPFNRAALLRAADAVAAAERAKANWVPKKHRPRHRKLARCSVKAAELVVELAEMFPAPWTGTSREVGVLVTQLMALVDTALRATTVLDRDRAVWEAASHVRRLRKLPDGRVPWELLRDLAWLASGKDFEFSERTLRRYLNHKALEPPAGRVWESNFPKLRSAASRAGRLPKGLLKDAVRRYLTA